MDGMINHNVKKRIETYYSIRSFSLNHSKFLTQSLIQYVFPGSAGGGEKGRWNVLLERNYNL